MKQATYLITYKDAPNAPDLIFGPFVNLALAEEFSREIPSPEAGGSKKLRTLQRFGASEAHMVRDLILTARTHRHNREAA